MDEKILENMLLRQWLAHWSDGSSLTAEERHDVEEVLKKLRAQRRIPGNLASLWIAGRVSASSKIPRSKSAQLSPRQVVPALAAASDPRNVVRVVGRSIKIDDNEFIVSEIKGGGTLFEGSFSSSWSAVSVAGRPFSFEAAGDNSKRQCSLLSLRDLLSALRHGKEVHLV
jgi:hypothetical protein